MCLFNTPTVKQEKPTAPDTDLDRQRNTEQFRRNLPFNSLGLASTILTSGLGTTGKAPTSTVALGGGGTV